MGSLITYANLAGEAAAVAVKQLVNLTNPIPALNVK